MLMTDLEILTHAKTYLDKLADGVDPLSGEPVKDDDIVRNDRISKCLLYVSGVLTRVIENGGEVGRRRSGRAGFQIDPEKLGEIEFSDFPVGVSVLCDRTAYPVLWSRLSSLWLKILIPRLTTNRSVMRCWKRYARSWKNAVLW